MADEGFREEEIIRREERKMRKTFMVPIKGVWFDGFRKKYPILHPEEVLVELKKKKNKEEKV